MDATVTVEVSDAGPAAADDWHDVSSAVRGTVTWTRGKPDPMALGVPPGTASFQLRNPTGTYTPTSGARPTIGHKVRISLTYNSVTYRRWTGYVDTLEQGWDGSPDRSSYVNVTCTDALARLATRHLTGAAQGYYTSMDPLPVAYYPFNDDGPPFQDQSISNNRGLRRGGSGPTDLALGHVRRIDDGDGIPGFPGRPYAKFVNSSWVGWTGATVSYSANSEPWISGWFRVSGTPNANVHLIRMTGYTGANVAWSASLTLGTGGPVADVGYFNGLDDYGAASLAPTTVRWDDGKWHHVMFASTKASSTTATQYLWVDGVQQATGTISVAGNAHAWASITAIDLSVGDDSTSYGRGWAVDVAHVACWVSPSHNAAYVSALNVWTVGRYGLNIGDRSSERVTRALDWGSYPSASRSIDHGVIVLGDVDPKGQSVADVINDSVTAEVGNAWIGGDATFTFKSRSWRWQHSTPDATVAWFEPSMTWTTDLTSVYSRATVVLDEGDAVTRINQATESTYGINEITEDVPVKDANMADGLARFLLAKKGTPHPRASTLVYDLLTEPTTAQVEAMLGLDVWSLVTLSSLPATAFTSSTKQWVEQVTETVGPGVWTLELALSPWVSEGPYWALATGALGSTSSLDY